MNYREPRARACQDCGEQFMANSPAQKRCPTCQREAVLACKRRNSQRYYREVVRKVPTEKISCPHCGRVFLPHTRRQVYCSKVCSDRAAGARWRRRNGILPRDTRAKGSPAAVPAPVGPENSKRTTARDWMARVEMDLRIADPGERFKASARWSAQQRAYAQRLALRALGWRGAAY